MISKVQTYRTLRNCIFVQNNSCQWVIHWCFHFPNTRLLCHILLVKWYEHYSKDLDNDSLFLMVLEWTVDDEILSRMAYEVNVGMKRKIVPVLGRKRINASKTVVGWKFRFNSLSNRSPSVIRFSFFYRIKTKMKLTEK